MKFFATTAKGMESLLATELKALGAAGVSETKAGVSFEGELEIAYRACLWSRVANRILIPLKTFPAPTPEKLYGGVKSIRWSDHVSSKNTIAVDFSTSHSQITHSHFGALKTKDAIVDQLRSVQGERPSVDPARPDVRVNVYLNNDEATVSIDLSGESLHRRGYRDESVPAPLKENLAAAILLSAGWSRDRGAFLDPMCGSGTLVIEAAMIAANIAPGLMREYWGFTGWQGHDAKLWSRLVSEAKLAKVKDNLPKIVGYDLDARAVRSAQSNIERAGLRTMVHVEKREMETAEAVAEKGLLIVNPPYGERIGANIPELYGALGDVLKKKFKGWDAGIFTGSLEGSKAVGLKASRRIVLFNGAMECRLLLYSMY